MCIRDRVRVEGAVTADSVLCRVESADTLRQVVHRIPRRFLFIRWGTKALRQEIVPSNPCLLYTSPLHTRLRRTAADARRPADHAPRRRGRHGPRAGRCGRRVGRPRGMGRGTRPVGNRKPFAHTRQGGRGPGAEHRRIRLRSQRRDRAGAHVLHRQPLGNGHRRRTLLLRLPRKHLQARTAGALSLIHICSRPSSSVRTAIVSVTLYFPCLLYTSRCV